MEIIIPPYSYSGVPPPEQVDLKMQMAFGIEPWAWNDDPIILPCRYGSSLLRPSSKS